MMYGVKSGQQRTVCRQCGRRRRYGVREKDPVTDKAVNHGSFDTASAITANMVCTRRIGRDEHNVESAEISRSRVNVIRRRELRHDLARDSLELDSTQHVVDTE